MAQDPVVLRLINQQEDKPDVFCSKWGQGKGAHAHQFYRPRWDLSGRRGQVTFWGAGAGSSTLCLKDPAVPRRVQNFFRSGALADSAQSPTKGQNSSSAFVLSPQNG